MNRYRPTLLFAVLASLFVILAACGEPDEPSEEAAADGAEVVRQINAVFEPSELTISVGTEVVFTNEDSYAHTVSEGTDGNVVDDPIVDEEVAAGGEVRVTFDEAGTYDITCEIHPDMQMTITVED